MSDTLMTIIGIFVAFLIMLILPLMIFANKNDEIAQTVVQTAVSDFVNTVTVKGKITLFDYNDLVTKIDSTGNTYDIQIEAQILDDNPRRTVTAVSSEQLGDYKYYSVYTNEILEYINNEDIEEYNLKKDDYVVVNVKNTNMTIGDQFKNIFYKLIGKDTYAIGTSATGVVVNSGNQGNEENGKLKENTLPFNEKTVEILSNKIETTEKNNVDVNIVVVVDCDFITPFTTLIQEIFTSSTALEKINNSVNNGSIKFVLTKEPSKVYSFNDLKNINILNLIETLIFKDNDYEKAMETALNEMPEVTEGKCNCIAVYSDFKYTESIFPKIQEEYESKYKNKYNSAIKRIKDNQEKYDLLFTIKSTFLAKSNAENLWHEKISEEKYGGFLTGEKFEENFKSLINVAISKKSVSKSSVSNNKNTIESSDLKIVLEDLDEKKYIYITINETKYIIGNSISTLILYYDNGKKDYIIDLKLLKEIMNMTTEEFDNSEIMIEYSKK